MDDTQLLQKFQALNRERIKRLSSLLPAKHAGFIDFLPVLFQSNSEALPGYMSDSESPAGIANYQLTQQTLNTTKKYFNAFAHQHHPLNYYPIQSILLIHDYGIYNFSVKDPFEVWIVLSEQLSTLQQSLFSKKALAITKWANEEKISIKIRTFNQASLTKEEISPHDLDRLYSNGLLLAGHPPEWWLSKQQASSDTVNFGFISEVSPQELFELTFTAINTAMDKGLESCLELIFSTCSLDAFPDFSWPSELLKQKIIDGNIDPMSLDINSLKLDILTQYLPNNSTTLTLAQQSLYYKSKELLSKNIKQAQYPWRRNYIKSQYDSWQWSEDDTLIMRLGLQAQYRNSLPLFQLVRTQLISSMATLSSFTKQHGLKTSLRPLQQKFEVMFKEQADTLNHLPVAFFPRHAEEHAYLSRSKKTNEWAINDKPATLSKTALYQHPSLLNVLAWAVNNRLISKTTLLKVADETLSINTHIVIELTQQLLRSPLATTPVSPKLEQLAETTKIKHILLFVNIEAQSSNSLSQHGLEMSSLQADPLNYANKKQNLVVAIEGLICSSLGQWHYYIYTGEDCLLQLLNAILRWHPSSLTMASCWCNSGNQGQNINNRIEKIFNHVLSQYTTHSDDGEYLISLGDNLYQLRWQDGLSDVSPLGKKNRLLQHLAKEKTSYYKTFFDPTLDKNSLLSILFDHYTLGQINLYLLTVKSSVFVYIFDEKGSVFTQHFNDMTENTLSSHFRTFLSSANTIKHYFFKIHQHQESPPIITGLSIAPEPKSNAYLPVIIEMDSPNDNAQCTIHCGTKTFTNAADNPTLFSHVKALLINIRKSKNNYPLYISVLKFKEQNIHTRDYIIQKQRLELLLNK